jgi:glycerol-3-phosphate acyltransferase PlsY
MQPSILAAAFPAPRDLLWLAACYALGCLTAAFYLTRWTLGKDLRNEGSGNLGARNAGRILGRWGFVAVFLWDALKGFVAVAVASVLGGTALAVAALIAVTLGHTWPAQLGFRGGKGIAVSIGAVLALDPLALGLLVVACLPPIALLRSFTMGGLVAFALGPALAWVAGRPDSTIAALSFIAPFVLYTHRRNIADAFARWRTRAARLPVAGSHDVQ